MTDRTMKEEFQRLLPKPSVLAAWFVVAVAFVWFYSGPAFFGEWHTSPICYLYRSWQTPDYGHGFVVPIFALFLLWLRRDMIVPFAGRWSWWGLPVLALWATVYWVAVYFNYGSLPQYSMLVFFTGVALFAGGWQGLRWSWPSIAFLVFMVPLPGALQGWFSFGLQGIAARSGAYVIQTLGIPAMTRGHVILVGVTANELDVAAACSGLRMMMLFFAICVGAALVVRKPLWEKLLMIASAIPIAVVSNVARIVLVALLTELAQNWPSGVRWLVNPDHPQEFFDKWVGMLLMMPIGLLLLWAEMALLSKLLVAPLPDRPLVMGRLAAAKQAAEAGNKRTDQRKIPR
jgi:exosortase